ncbi:MAG TPA: PAS domain S-box protein, partial [Candidatus Eisenbacteria bacterium]|nr:PAS domain S-box protein [Candidatus Eisenbacteria bacterium]
MGTTRLHVYLMAVAAALVAVFVRWALDPWLSDQLRYVPLIGAVAWVVYYAGYRPATLAAVVGFIAGTLLRPDGFGTLEDPQTLVAFAVYCITCSLIIVLGESQKRARSRMDTSLEQQRVTFASIGDGVITTDAGGRITYLNPVAESLTGWSIDEAKGQPLGSVFLVLNEETREEVENPVDRVLQAGIIVGLANHTVLVAKDGTERPIDDSAGPIRDQDGRIIGVVMVFRDVTERRQLENMRRDFQHYLEQQVEERTVELRSSEERFRLLVEGTRDVAIFMLDPTGRIVSWNTGAERIKGYRSAEIIGRHFSIFYPPEDIVSEKPARELETAAREGKYEEEGWRLRKDGTQFWASVVITALRDESGSLRGYSKVTRDFSEKRAAEESARLLLQEETARRSAELHAREVEAERERLRVTLTSIGDAVIATDQEGRVEILNPIAETLTGWSNSEAMGRPLHDVFRIVNEFTRQPVEDPVAKVLATGRIMGLANHTILVSRDGTEHPIDDSAAPILDAYGNMRGAVLVFRDIAEAKRAGQTSRRLALIVESSQDAIIGKDTDGIVTSWNRGAEQLYGYLAQEMIGQSITRLVPADRLGEFADIMERIRHGQHIEPYETVRVRKDGRHIEVAVTISPLEDEHGTIIGASAIARDITDRKRAEESLREGAERLRVALLALKEADRRKDEFLATLAHELRNPLAPIRNAVEVLKEASDDPNLRWSRDVIDRQVRHMTRLLEDLLDVSRISHNKLELRRERTGLAEVIQSAVETSRPIIDRGRHKLTLDVPGEPVFVDVDPVRMAQVFSNLLNNAAKYTQPGGHIRMGVARQGSEVVISIKDDGIGIAPEMMPHIFD